MTRKHYIAAADILRTEMSDGVFSEVGKVFIAAFLCKFFKRDNPRFSTDRFMEACQINVPHYLIDWL